MQSFVVYKKNLSVHTEDRDIKKWPTSTVFDVELPVEYKNVVSLRLSDIQLPASYYVFSMKNQNTIFTVTVGSVTKKVTIQEGTYSPQQLMFELMGQLNKSFSNFKVIYNSTSMKFAFTNTDSFSFHFDKPEYDGSFYDQYSQWGLGSYLGFCKEVYTSTLTSYTAYGDNIEFTNTNVVESPFVASLYGDSHIYMELDFYNSMDEIAPYTERSNQQFNAKYSGNHNSAFAKIPTLAVANQKQYVSKETFLSNLFFSDPPLERVQKFKFRFRYHDGRPVNFGNTNFSFTIEVTMLRPDSVKPSIEVHSNHYRIK